MKCERASHGITLARERASHKKLFIGQAMITSGRFLLLISRWGGSDLSFRFRIALEVLLSAVIMLMIWRLLFVHLYRVINSFCPHLLHYYLDYTI